MALVKDGFTGLQFHSIGASIFLLSDSILGIRKFYMDRNNKDAFLMMQIATMVTYYTALLLIGLSAL